ncbi:MAG: hypothetical protein IJD97_12510 [Clostridia bacterium]|nr:hypothetical protein [Clostridia bacterium]
MKVCTIQPLYPTDYSRSEEMFLWEIEAMDKCDESMDLIVLPESTDVPCFAKTREMALESYKKFNRKLIEKASETAKRCNAVLFINAYKEVETGLRNTTYAFDREGKIAGYYFKQHLTPGETSERKLDSDYTFEFSDTDIITIDGIRYAFLTCYDFYFYEAFAKIALARPDIIIGCSHQRSDTHEALSIMSKFLAYNTNAYVVRSSVSMDEESTVGGGSMVVSPRGEMLLNMGSKVGMECVEINPEEKYYKPGGFGNPDMAHFEYIEKGRRPWKYRPAGSAIVKHDALMPYPRICAHRGFNTVAPENSMPAFGAAVALGAEEIEFDLWYTKDGEVVSLHDPDLDRVSDGTGKVYDHTYEELLAYDFGIKYSEEFKGLKILKFEEILKKFACHVIMNIHIKSVDNINPLPEEYLKKIIDLIRKYDCEKYSYFMTGNDTVLGQLQSLAPDICRCCGGGDAPLLMVERGIKYGCKKIQLVKWAFNEEMIKKAHDAGMRCTIFWSDEIDEAKKFLDMGVDVILTNDYQRISQIIK